jgi:large subunit ribosomal protein L25
MKTLSLDVFARQGSGKGVARKLRREGLVPAVIYGHETIKSLAVRLKDLQKILKVSHGSNAILEVVVDGAKKTALLKDMQVDPIGQQPIHIDLFEVSMDQKIRVMVEVVAKGEEPAGIKQGGILTRSLSEVEVECLPLDIPSSIEVDLSGLDLGDAFHVSDLPDTGLDILTSGEQLLFAVVAPTVEKEPEEAEAVEGVEGEEAPAPEGEEGEAPPPESEKKSDSES